MSGAMPYFKLSEVAQRLGVKEYWLQGRLVADRRSRHPRLQFHHYVGVTRVWTLDALESLREAMADELDEKHRRAGNGRPRQGPRVKKGG
jgi:hypothetical protein